MSTAHSPAPRPTRHQKNKSSKSGILKSLVSPKSRPVSPDLPCSRSHQFGAARTQQVSLLSEGLLNANGAKPFGERHANAQPSSTSPSKGVKDLQDFTHGQLNADNERTKKTKSTANLQSVISKINRSSKDVSKWEDEKGKENSTPSIISPTETPIWAHFASSFEEPAAERLGGCEDRRQSIKEEITRYTPLEYSPSKQKNFHGSSEQLHLQPTLCSHPQSSSNFNGTGKLCVFGRKASNNGTDPKIGTSKNDVASAGNDINKKLSNDKTAKRMKGLESKESDGGDAQLSTREKLNVTKRGGRVMAAVAAFQRNAAHQKPSGRVETEFGAEDVEKAFEAVLEARNIPEPMRQKMRTLTLRVKTDFVKQDQGSTSAGGHHDDAFSSVMASVPKSAAGENEEDEAPNDSKSTKRSRPRSRTFTFSKADKRGNEASPSKKQRPHSKAREEEKARPVSIHIPRSNNHKSSAPSTPTHSSFGRSSQVPAAPASFILYLKENPDPTVVEVGRLHKLRILLRNETVAWVDNFISQGGMGEIVALIHRLIQVEWREEHEDQLLHESLLCLKGLCTTERAMVELDKFADHLFPALVAMLFDEEKKGPAEYSTRTIIIQLLFKFLSSSKETSAPALEQRAHRILSYVSEPCKSEDEQPVSFVLEMRASRPYKTWCGEISNVTREVFWIFLHHLNVIPLHRPGSSQANAAEEREILAATYTQRHFPGSRPPVPAAPYIGGVEWDATTYLTAHLDLVNGLISSLPSPNDRNKLRGQLQASGFEKVAGCTMRTCKEKFYGGVHDGLRSWVAAAAEDDWDTRYVREGPTQVEQADQARKILSSPKKSPKKPEPPPQLEAPKLDLGLSGHSDGNDEGWLE